MDDGCTCVMKLRNPLENQLLRTAAELYSHYDGRYGGR